MKLLFFFFSLKLMEFIFENSPGLKYLFGPVGPYKVSIWENFKIK